MLDRTLDTVDDHAGEHERAVVVGAHEIARLEQFVDALQREEARLGHDDEMRRSSKGVQGEHAEAWRAVDQHDVVVGYPLQLAPQYEFVGGRAPRFAGRKRRLRRRNVEPPTRLRNGVG